MSAVYCIKNEQNGKVYIGSALRVNFRFNQHRSLLRRNKHPNSYLQRAWNKQLEKSFKFSVIEHTTPTEQLVREQYWLDKFRSYLRCNGYNLSKKRVVTTTV